MNNYYYDLIIMVEEPSMKKLLDKLLPRILSPKITFKCIPHEGKQDLEKSIPRKLKVFNPNKKFLIIRDQDSGNCQDIKQKLLHLCHSSGKKNIIIRIVCHELESWFLGDLKAVEKAFNLQQGKLSKLQNKSKYRNPDQINSAKQELRKLIPNYSPNTHADKIADNFNLVHNKSISFQVLIKTLKNI